MKSKWMTILIVFSVTVNIATVATLAYFWRHKPLPWAPPPVERELIHRPGRAWQDMQLPPKTKCELFALRRQFQREIVEKRRLVDDSRLQVMQQLSRPTIVQDSLDMALRILADRQLEMEKMTVKHLLEMRSLLSDDQWQKLLLLVERDKRGLQRSPLAPRGRPFEELNP